MQVNRDGNGSNSPRMAAMTSNIGSKRVSMKKIDLKQITSTNNANDDGSGDDEKIDLGLDTNVRVDKKISILNESSQKSSPKNDDVK